MWFVDQINVMGVDTDYGREGYKTHYTGVDLVGLTDNTRAGKRLVWTQSMVRSNWCGHNPFKG